MFRVDEETGNMTLRQGDSGEYTLTDLPTEKNYTYYLAIQDEKRRPVGGEISVVGNKSDVITFVLTAGLTDLLTVPAKEDYATYYFGIKACSDTDGIEDTLVIGSSDIDTLNTITVYPKKVEGTINA